LSIPCPEFDEKAFLLQAETTSPNARRGGPYCKADLEKEKEECRTYIFKL
jgi:hypothetical protein